MERPPDQPPSRSADYCTKKSFFQVNFARDCFLPTLRLYHFQNFTRKPSFKQLVRSSSDGTDMSPKSPHTTTTTTNSTPHSKSPSHKTSPSHSNQGDRDDKMEMMLILQWCWFMGPRYWIHIKRQNVQYSLRIDFLWKKYKFGGNTQTTGDKLGCYYNYCLLWVAKEMHPWAQILYC